MNTRRRMKNGNPGGRAPAQATAVRRNAPRRRRRRTPQQAGNPVNAYALMVSDPCGCALVPGIYGTVEGLLSRFKSTTLNNSAGTNGYLLWCPIYDSPASVGDSSLPETNTWGWTSSLANELPQNSIPVPFASNPNPPWVDGESFSLEDPAHQFVQGNVCADARVISACMRMTYLGQLQNSSGQFGFIENLPTSQLLFGSTISGPVSVDQLFNHCTQTSRFGVDTIELVYSAADRNSDIFTDPDDGALTSGSVGVFETKVSPKADTLGPKCFGFCWRGVDPSQISSINFEFIKNIEWRPEASSGLPEVPLKHLGPSRLPVAQALMDRVNPDWTRKIVTSVKSRMGEIAQNAFGGIADFITNPATISKVGSLAATAIGFL